MHTTSSQVYQKKAKKCESSELYQKMHIASWELWRSSESSTI